MHFIVPISQNIFYLNVDYAGKISIKVIIDEEYRFHVVYHTRLSLYTVVLNAERQAPNP